MPILQPPPVGETSIVLENLSWASYEALLADDEFCRGKRLFYDRGRLEIVSPSGFHESVKRLIGRFIEIMTLELGIDVASCGSLTCKRQDIQRGFEPDECYYVESEALMRGRRDEDFTRDPPPDLIVEVDISRSSVVRHGIFAAFGVPEIWRFDGQKLRFLALRSLVEGGPARPVETSPTRNLPSGSDSGRPPAESDYVEVPASRSFPFLAPADLEPFLARHGEESETAIVAAFRDWVRTAIAGR